MGYECGRSDINEIRYEYRYGIWNIELGYGISIWYYHIDMVILDIDMGYGLLMRDDNIVMVILDMDMISCHSACCTPWPVS